MNFYKEQNTFLTARKLILSFAETACNSFLQIRRSSLILTMPIDRNEAEIKTRVCIPFPNWPAHLVSYKSHVY